MNNGTKSAISRIWNETQDVHLCAERTGVTFADVVAYLKTRRGYPNGKIEKGDRARSDTRPLKVSDAQYGKHGPTPKPTLPRLKFLDGCE